LRQHRKGKRSKSAKKPYPNKGHSQKQKKEEEERKKRKGGRLWARTKDHSLCRKFGLETTQRKKVREARGVRRKEGEQHETRCRGTYQKVAVERGCVKQVTNLGDGEMGQGGEYDNAKKKVKSRGLKVEPYIGNKKGSHSEGAM